MNAISTMEFTREEWLAMRKPGLGSSDAPKVAGVSDYGGRVDVYLDKTGQAEPIPDNPRMRAGREMEDTIARLFSEELNLKVRRDNKIRFHPDFDFLLANLDRTIVSVDDRGPGILECKNTNSFRLRKAEEEFWMPLDWYVQVQHQLAVTGYRWAWLAAWVDGWELRTYEIRPDPELQERLITAEVSLWVDHIVPRVPPPPSTAEETLALFPRHKPGLAVEASPELVMLVNRLIELKGFIAPLENEKKAIEDTIKSTFGEAEALTFAGQTVATWKASKDSTKFDADRFQADHPELFAQYQRTVPGSRRLLLK